MFNYNELSCYILEPDETHIGRVEPDPTLRIQPVAETHVVGLGIMGTGDR